MARSRRLRFSCPALPFEVAHPRRHQVGPEAVAGEIGAAGRLAPAEGEAHDGPEQTGRGLVDRGVEDGDGQRLPQPLQQRAGAAEPPGRGIAIACAGQRQAGEIVVHAAAGHAAPRRHDPPRQRAGIGAHGPALARAQVDEGEGRARLADQAALGADRLQVGEHRGIGAQDQVVAIVDRPVQGGIVERTAAAAGLGRRLPKDDALPRLHQLHGARKPRHAGADHVNGRHDPSHPSRRVHV